MDHRSQKTPDQTAALQHVLERWVESHHGIASSATAQAATAQAGESTANLVELRQKAALSLSGLALVLELLSHLNIFER